jgi:hypothetical protein
MVLGEITLGEMVFSRNGHQAKWSLGEMVIRRNRFSRKTFLVVYQGSVMIKAEKNL